MTFLRLEIEWEEGFVAPKYLSLSIPSKFYAEGIGKFIMGWLYGVYQKTPKEFMIVDVEEVAA